MASHPSILCVRPWITDFAAYNLWAEPLGLFTVASALRQAGAEVRYIDCLAGGPGPFPVPKPDGRSKFARTVVARPACLSFVPRRYARYGISEEEFLEALSRGSTPDVVLVSSMMTYWYPGVAGTIECVKRVLGGRVPVILGGVYATLCPDHARNRSGADYVYEGGLTGRLLAIVQDAAGKPLSPASLPTLLGFAEHPVPMHELQRGAVFFAVLTGRGCPFRCSYCASALLNPRVERRSVESVLTEIGSAARRLHTRNVAVYDDAFLFDADHHAVPLLEAIAESDLGLSLHFPNGLHARFVTPRVAGLLRRAGASRLWVGLETCDEELQDRTGRKLTLREYEEAVSRLRNAGFTREQTGTYVLAGYPGQKAADVERSIELVHRAGGSPYISCFSPIPGTAAWEEARASSPFPLDEEPLFHNKSVFILGNREFTPAALAELKAMAVERRRP